MVLFMSCVVHILSIIDAIFYPKLPTIKVYKKKLNKLDFPLSFRVCVEVNNEATEYQKVGYENKIKFIKGQNKYNNSIIGWAGLKIDGSVFGRVEGQFLVKMVVKWITVYLQMLFQT